MEDAGVSTKSKLQPISRSREGRPAGLLLGKQPTCQRPQQGDNDNRLFRFDPFGCLGPGGIGRTQVSIKNLSYQG